MTRAASAALVLVVAGCSAIGTEPGLPTDTQPPPVLWFESAVAEPPKGAVAVETELEISASPFLELGFAGDTSFTHGLAARDPFGDVVELLRVPDLTLVNLETTIGESSIGTPLDKEFVFRSPPESVALLSGGGVDGVALANNHSLDYGREALSRTLELLDQGGVGRSGAGRTAAEAYAPMVFVRDGTRVAVVSFSRILPGTWAALADRSGIASAYEMEETVSSIRTASGVADAVVVMVHWGVELDVCPQRYQRELATAWIDAGADLVVGSHPHVLQGVERIGDGWVVYSTGNFVFPSARQASAETALFRFTFHDGTISLAVDPLRISGGRPHPAGEGIASRILGLLSDRSFGFEFNSSGLAIPLEGRGRC